MHIKIEEVSDRSVLVRNIKDFDLEHTFSCGQCFRWHKMENNKYRGIAKGRILYLSNPDSDKTELFVENSTKDEFDRIWMDYFDLNTDYSQIKSILSRKDDVLKKAVEFGSGIRILKQDFYETMISFIISANNRIPMIMKVVETIARSYGEPIEYMGDTGFSFPGPDTLAKVNIEELALCKAGFRCKYIRGSSGLLESSALDPENLSELDTRDAREVLKQMPGIGNKVADCILLFSGIKRDVFPTDVWVKRIMQELYFKEEVSLKRIEEFACDYFGRYMGFAQQYLFYYARENRVGTV